MGKKVRKENWRESYKESGINKISGHFISSPRNGSRIFWKQLSGTKTHQIRFLQHSWKASFFLFCFFMTRWGRLPSDGDVAGTKGWRLMDERNPEREAVNSELWRMRWAQRSWPSPVQSSLSVFAGWTLSSLRVLSHPETGERPLPGGCRPKGHNNHWDRAHLEDQVHREVQGRLDVPSARLDRPDHSQVCLVHLCSQTHFRPLVAV